MSQVSSDRPWLSRILLSGGLTVALLGSSLAFATVAQASTPFSCESAFYQVSGANSGGGLYQVDVSGASMTRIGSGSATGINAVGYNSADNLLYGVVGHVAGDGSTSFNLISIDSTGSFTDLGTIGGPLSTGQGQPSSVVAGDFSSPNVLTVSRQPDGAWFNIPVNSLPANSTPLGLTIAAVDNVWQPGGDFAFNAAGTVAYALGDLSGQTTLTTIDFALTPEVSHAPVSGAGGVTDVYGAAYLDAGGDAFFYDNMNATLFEITADQLGQGSPVAVAVARPTPALAAPLDGASCSSAPQPPFPPLPAGDPGQVPPAWDQAIARPTSTSTCPTGMNPSWAQWPNHGSGGYTCEWATWWDTAAANSQGDWTTTPGFR